MRAISSKTKKKVSKLTLHHICSYKKKIARGKTLHMSRRLYSSTTQTTTTTVTNIYTLSCNKFNARNNSDIDNFASTAKEQITMYEISQARITACANLWQTKKIC